MNFLSLSLVSAALICVFATNVFEQNIPEDSQLEDSDVSNFRCADVCKTRKLHVTVYCCYQNTFRFFYARRSVKVSLPRKKVCRGVPGVGRYYAKSHVCVDVDFVDYKKRVVCAKIFGTIRIGWKSFPVDHDFSCFKLPSPSDVDNAVDLLEPNSIGTEPSLEEDIDLEQDDLGENDLNPV